MLNFRSKHLTQVLVDKDFLNDKDGSKAKQDWENGKLGIFASAYWDEDIYTALLKTTPDADVISIPLPKSAFGQFSPAVIPSIQLIGAVNAKAKDPEAVMTYIDFMTQQSTMNKLSYGDQDTDYTMVNNCQVLKDPANPKFAFTYVYNMLYSAGLFGACGDYVTTLHVDSNPIDKKWADIYAQAKANYLSPDRPFPAFILPDFAPALPSDLQTISSSVVGSMIDLTLKSIVSGSSYTPDQAVKDEMNLWNKSGGQKIDFLVARLV